MPPLRDTIETIVFKYDIKKEYFTVGIPILIAVALVVIAILAGHTLSAQQQGSDQIDAKQQAYEELLRQMNETDNNTATTSSGSTSTPPATTADLDNFIIYAVIIAITPFSIDRYFDRRNAKKHDEDFTQFLFKLSEMMRAGIDPIKSIIELSKTDLGSITPYVRAAAASMLLGKSFEEGMRGMAESLHSEMITKYIDLVIQASYMGGAVHDLILKASEDMRSMIMIEREMQSSLSQYTLILYLAQAIIIFIAYILNTNLLPSIQGMGAQILGGGADLQSINFNQGFFHLIMINAAIGGIIIGKITEGSALDGLKHTAILMVSGYIICALVILPGVSSGNAVTISVVSGDNQSAYAGMQLQEPIVFKVVNSSGLAATDTYVQFNITPSGSMNPTFDKTDADGQVSTHATLGSDAGDYTITATVDKTVYTIIIKTTSGG
jgi:archaeal flagellar protein FlaJ